MRRSSWAAGSTVAAVLALVAFASPANADITVTLSNGAGLSASATFSINGDGDLVITLTNVSSSDVEAPSQLLTAVFFNAPGTLTPVSALLADGSTILYGDYAENVGGEWAYASGLDLNGANMGISSTGLDIFGDGNFNGDNLNDPDAVNGMNYGIVSAGDDPDTANGGLADEPLIDNSVVFTLSGWDSDWDLSEITNVWFQYGTSFDEPSLIPEPGVVALLAVGLLGFAFAARKLSWA